MIRRDYIVRMIEEFVRALSLIKNLKKEQRYHEASTAIDEQLRQLLGADSSAAVRMSEAELLAKVSAF